MFEGVAISFSFSTSEAEYKNKVNYRISRNTAMFRRLTFRFIVFYTLSKHPHIQKRDSNPCHAQILSGSFSDFR